jgi:exonuclease VII small subunit
VDGVNRYEDMDRDELIEQLRALERAADELERANRELASGIYGKHDAAAVAYSRRMVELETRAWILGEEKRLAEARAAQIEAWHDAARYVLVDRAVARVKRIPVVYPAVRGVRAVYRRVRPRERPALGAPGPGDG